MTRLTRRATLAAGLSVTGTALLGSGVLAQIPPRTCRRPSSRSSPGRSFRCCARASSSRATRPCGRRTPRSSRRRPASRSPSTARAGRICGRRRRSPRTSAAAPTWCWPGRRTHTSSPTSSSRSMSWPTISAASTAAGSRWPRSSGRRRAAGWRMPVGGNGSTMVYRQSWVREAGFDAVPGDFPGYLRLCQGLQKIGHPSGFALGNAVGDSGWTVLGALGLRQLDDRRERARRDRQPQNHRGAGIRQGALRHLHPGHARPGSIRRTTRRSSPVTSRLTRTASRSTTRPRTRGPEAQGDRRGHRPRQLPDRAGRLSDARACWSSTGCVFKLHEIPERRPRVPALHDGGRSSTRRGSGEHRLLVPPAQGLRPSRSGPRTRRSTPYRDIMRNAPAAELQGPPEPGGGRGQGRLRRACNMFQAVCSGQATPQEARQEAQRRAERYYKRKPWRGQRSTGSPPSAPGDRCRDRPPRRVGARGPAELERRFAATAPTRRPTRWRRCASLGPASAAPPRTAWPACSAPRSSHAEARDLRHQRRRPRDHRPAALPRARHHRDHSARALRRRRRSRAGAGARGLPPDRRGRPLRALWQVAGAGWRSAASSPACAPASWASAASAWRSPRRLEGFKMPDRLSSTRCARDVPTGAIRTRSRSRASRDILFLCAAGGPKGASTADRRPRHHRGARAARRLRQHRPRLAGRRAGAGRGPVAPVGLGAAGLDVFYDEPKVPRRCSARQRRPHAAHREHAPRRRWAPWARASPAISSSWFEGKGALTPVT